MIGSIYSLYNESKRIIILLIFNYCVIRTYPEFITSFFIRVFFPNPFAFVIMFAIFTLGKFGFSLEANAGGDWISWDGKRGQAEDSPLIETYHDHRMAMAFAPLAVPFGKLTVNDPMVVTKSYPAYWQDLEKAGFSLSNL